MEPSGGGRASSQVFVLRQCVRNSHQFEASVASAPVGAILYFLHSTEEENPRFILRAAAERAGKVAIGGKVGWRPVDTSVDACIAQATFALLRLVLGAILQLLDHGKRV
jgi:hypothetical protein